MIKFTSRDILHMLVDFSQATKTNSPADIKNISITHPEGSHSAIKFQFRRRQYYILIDNTADDDQDYIRSQLDWPEAEFVRLASDSLPLIYRGKTVYLLQGPAEDIRLDNLLSQKYPETSRSSWQRHIKSGYVLINSKPASSPSTRVTSSDQVTVDIPDRTDHSDQSLPIIYQDDSLLVINKPVGVLTHAKGAIADEFTVADFFARYTSWATTTNRPGIIHRLDRATSGVLAGALNESAAKMLQRQFSERKVKKTYYAVVDGVIDQPEAIIDLPIERNPSTPSQFRVGASGKPAVTRYKVISSGNNRTLIELKPTTGRTHQLRVHMSYIGHPIVGDVVYGGSKADRMMLHAYELELTRPDRVRDTFRADAPAEFKEQVK